MFGSLGGLLPGLVFGVQCLGLIYIPLLPSLCSTTEQDDERVGFNREGIMHIDNEKFKLTFRELLSQHTEDLLDYQLTLMEQEIAEGWRCCYAREIWFKENLPPPLMNELGRRYMTEKLKVNLYRDTQSAHFYHIEDVPSDYVSEFLLSFIASPANRIGYRNFLDVGLLEMEAIGNKPEPYDLIANEITKRMVEEQHRH